MTVDFKKGFKTPTVKYHHTLTKKPDAAAFERHCHTDYELLYVVNGAGKYVTEGREYPILPGTLLFQRPFEFHSVIPDENVPYERYVLNFDYNIPKWDANFKAMLKSDDPSAVGVYYTEESFGDCIKNAFAMLDTIHEKLLPAGADISKVQLMFETVITQVLLILASVEEADSSVCVNKTVFKIIEYVNENLTADISLDTIAGEFYMSKYHLCRTFMKFTGVSLFSYVTAKRIALAQSLISAGEHPTDVSYKVGFSDYSTFYRAYKKQTGHSPSK